MPDWGRGSSGDRSGFQRYIETLREHILLIVTCMVIAVAGAVAYVKLAPRSYTATAELEANAAPSTDTVLNSLPVLHQSGDPTQDVLTAAALVATPQVADSVIKDLGLKTSPNALLGKVSATPQGQSDIVDIQATGSSPKEAQRLANAFANQTIAVTTAAMHAQIARIVPSLRSQIATLPSSEQYAAGSPGQELSEYEQYQLSNNPTLDFIGQAQLPTSPSSPHTGLSLAAGLFGGLLIGIAAAFVFSAIDPRVRREEQLRELFSGVPVLARIPRVGHKQRSRPLVPSDMSVVAREGYRTLRTTLASRAGQEPQAYLVTGSAPSEGKTTTAIGLATSLAQAGGRVILIEADLRRPTIASSLGIQVARGVEQVLIGESDMNSALQSVTIDGVPLRVLAAARSGAQVADRLSVAVARHLIQSAKRQADFVVIDSPPLSAVIDALPLAQLADEVLIVARMGYSRLNKLAELEQLLTSQAAPPTGLVLVGSVSGRAARYNYYAYMPDGEPSNGGRDPASAQLSGRWASRSSAR
jgi:polysaccharide biosynthesis transport protein